MENQKISERMFENFGLVCAQPLPAAHGGTHQQAFSASHPCQAGLTCEGSAIPASSLPGSPVRAGSVPARLTCEGYYASIITTPCGQPGGYQSPANVTWQRQIALFKCRPNTQSVLHCHLKLRQSAIIVLARPTRTIVRLRGWASGSVRAPFSPPLITLVHVNHALI